MSSLHEKVVLAIDPGSSKCGLALVRRTEESNIELLWRDIVPPEELTAALDKAKAVAPYSMVIVGSGTKATPTVTTIRDAMPAMGILVIDEKDTTMQARERYWEHNPRRSWRRLFPSTMLSPPDPVDDFAALILAERVLSE